jgi:hypothetical protein
MIYRAIVLSLAIVVGLGAILPLATLRVEASSHKQKRAKKGKKYKKYSKKWWRAYRQRIKRQKALNARKRSLRLRQIRLANQINSSENGGANMVKASNPNRKSKAVVADNVPAMLPSGEIAPKGWKRGVSTSSELQYSVDDESGTNIGSASISVVGPAVGADNDNAQNKTVGGVSTSALRRTVIDRMIREEGWVVNDYQKDVGGRKVYVVVAQSPGAGGTVQSRLFYFTEVDGRIYSVAANAPKDNLQRIEQESEKAITSLRRKPNPVQQAELK